MVNLALPHIPLEFPTKWHLVPGFHHTLIGVVPLCDANCGVTFTRKAIIVRYKQGTAVLSGWRESTGPRLWRISLQPGESDHPSMPNDDKQATLAEYSAHDLPSVATFFRYFHAAAGFPVRSTWTKAIGAGNYSSWPGLTLTNATKYFPSAEATIMGHLIQKRQGIRSTKPKPLQSSSPDTPQSVSPEEPLLQVRSNNLFLQVAPISKLYTDDTGCFPVCARSGHQYVMIVYHRDANLILAVPFKTSKNTHRLQSYNKIIQRIRDHQLRVDLQIMDNEASAYYKRLIKVKWKINYQLVLPNTHQSNVAERAIRNFKAHFISVLARVAPGFPRNLWDLLLTQTEVTLKLLQKATLDPSISVWA